VRAAGLTLSQITVPATRGSALETDSTLRVAGAFRNGLSRVDTCGAPSRLAAGDGAPPGHPAEVGERPVTVVDALLQHVTLTPQLTVVLALVATRRERDNRAGGNEQKPTGHGPVLSASQLAWPPVTPQVYPTDPQSMCDSVYPWWHSTTVSPSQKFDESDNGSPQRGSGAAVSVQR